MRPGGTDIRQRRSTSLSLTHMAAGPVLNELRDVKSCFLSQVPFKCLTSSNPDDLEQETSLDTMTKEELQEGLTQVANDVEARTKITKAYLAEAGPQPDLSGLKLNNVDLRDADLTGANLQGADLRDANLHDACLEGANLEKANLSNARLDFANLTNANLQDADCYCAKMSLSTKLNGANLANTDLRGVSNSRGEGIDKCIDLTKAKNFEQAKGVDVAEILEKARQNLKNTMSMRVGEYCEKNNCNYPKALYDKMDKLIAKSKLSSLQDFNKAREVLLTRGDPLCTTQKTMLGLGPKQAKLDEQAFLNEFAKAQEAVKQDVSNQALFVAPAEVRAATSPSVRESMQNQAQGVKAGAWQAGVKPTKPRPAVHH